MPWEVWGGRLWVLNIQLVNFAFFLFNLELLPSAVLAVSVSHLCFTFSVHCQSSLRIREGSAWWVEDLATCLLLKQTFSHFILLGSDFPATSRRLALSVPETSVGPMGYTRLYFNLPHSHLNLVFPSSESVSTPVFLFLSPHAYLKMNISSPPFSSFKGEGRWTSVFNSPYWTERRTNFSLLVCSSFYFYLTRLLKKEQ